MSDQPKLSWGNAAPVPQLAEAQKELADIIEVSGGFPASPPSLGAEPPAPPPEAAVDDATERHAYSELLTFIGQHKDEGTLFDALTVDDFMAISGP